MSLGLAFSFAIGLALLSLGVIGWFTPYPTNPLRMRGRWAFDLPVKWRARIPRILAVILLVGGVCVITDCGLSLLRAHEARVAQRP